MAAVFSRLEVKGGTKGRLTLKVNTGVVVAGDLLGNRVDDVSTDNVLVEDGSNTDGKGLEVRVVFELACGNKGSSGKVWDPDGKDGFIAGY